MLVLEDSGSGARKSPAAGIGAGLLLHDYSGGVLLSQGGTPQVPSALASLTSVFGMGTGVTSPLWPPENVLSNQTCSGLSLSVP